MRVTLVSRIYDPEPGAASFRLRALVRALAASGDRVTVLTTRYGEVRSTTGDGVRVRRWPVLRDRTGYVRGYLQYLSFDVPAFFRVLLGRRADVVVVEPPPTTGVLVRLACALRRVPYVYYAADVWADASTTTGASGAVVAVLRRLERWAWGGARGVLAVSDGVTARIGRTTPGARVVRVGNGIDTTVFSRPTSDEGGAPDADHRDLDPYLVYAGTASEWHGATVFVEAMREVHRTHPDARLVFVGQGAEWDAIAAAAATLPEGVVQMLPRVAGPQAAQWLRGARASLASVRPGTPYEFAFPTKAYASMACGTPVVYSGGGVAGAEILASGTGWSVPQEPDAVAAAMRSALDAPVAEPDRAALAAWALEHVSMTAAAVRAAQEVHRAGGAPPAAQEPVR
jgi:glycosyltransferase involved in cell wall biosynthesis